MRNTPRVLVAVMAIAVFGLTSSALAQMHRGAPQGHGPVVQTARPMMPAERMMRNADTMMANAASRMRDLSAMRHGIHQPAHHQQMIGSLETMMAHMREVHGTLGTLMHDPALHQNRDAMRAFQESCRNFEQMAHAFESMAKHLTTIVKGAKNDRKP